MAIIYENWKKNLEEFVTKSIENETVQFDSYAIEGKINDVRILRIYKKDEEVFSKDTLEFLSMCEYIFNENVDESISFVINYPDHNLIVKGARIHSVKKNEVHFSYDSIKSEDKSFDNKLVYCVKKFTRGGRITTEEFSTFKDCLEFLDARISANETGIWAYVSDRKDCRWCKHWKSLFSLEETYSLCLVTKEKTTGICSKYEYTPILPKSCDLCKHRGENDRDDIPVCKLTGNSGKKVNCEMYEKVEE